MLILCITLLSSWESPQRTFGTTQVCLFPPSFIEDDTFVRSVSAKYGKADRSCDD